MHGSILILAKKKAAGPGGYFDPMAAPMDMAQGPMMFEMAQEDEDTDEQEMEASGKPELSKMDFRTAAGKLREIAMQLEQSSVKHAQQASSLNAIAGGKSAPTEAEEEEEDEDEGESEDMAPAMEAKAAPKPKAKKPFPGFLPKKVMKY
jgi:hypothetical protein